jgi:hypothetical protein
LKMYVWRRCPIVACELIDAFCNGITNPYIPRLLKTRILRFRLSVSDSVLGKRSARARHAGPESGAPDSTNHRTSPTPRRALTALLARDHLPKPSNGPLAMLGGNHADAGADTDEDVGADTDEDAERCACPFLNETEGLQPRNGTLPAGRHYPSFKV